MVMVEPLISVILPTYNRASSLRQTLASLAEQTLPADQYEVVVVDDGSTDGTQSVRQDSYPYQLRYIRQANRGDVAARNTGVRESRASFLVFIDDDILATPGYVQALFAAHSARPQHILMAQARYLPVDERAPFQSISATTQRYPTGNSTFVDLCTNSMALDRRIYLQVGLLQALDFPPVDVWCDVDFGYRAYKRGFDFVRVEEAVCYHRDHSWASLRRASQRMYMVGYRANALFDKYPELPGYLPMFEDKLPRSPDDSLRLTIRKSLRPLTSSHPALATLEWLAGRLESSYPESSLLLPLYRWVTGGHLYRGFRAGRTELGVR